MRRKCAFFFLFRANRPFTLYPQASVAIFELTRRLHQAYEQAYDKQAAEWLLPQEPRPQPHPTPTPQPDPCVTAAFDAIHQNGNRTEAARTAISSLLGEAARVGLTPPQAAYVLTTAEHESNMGNSMVEDRGYAARRNYNGGVAYRGRGYVHLTHIENYRHYGIADNPAAAAEPATAARIAVDGMTNGAFTGNTLEGSIPANGEPDFYNARWIIIGQNRHERGVARRLADNANDFLAALKGCGWQQ